MQTQGASSSRGGLELLPADVQKDREGDTARELSPRSIKTKPVNGYGVRGNGGVEGEGGGGREGGSGEAEVTPWLLAGRNWSGVCVCVCVCVVCFFDLFVFVFVCAVCAPTFLFCVHVCIRARVCVCVRARGWMERLRDFDAARELSPRTITTNWVDGEAQRQTT